MTNHNARPWRHNRYVYPLPECYVLTDTTQCTTRVRRDTARSKQCWILIYFRLENFSTTFENFISFSKYFKYDLDYPLLVLAQCLIVVQNYCKKTVKRNSDCLFKLSRHIPHIPMGHIHTHTHTHTHTHDLRPLLLGSKTTFTRIYPPIHSFPFR